MKQPSCHLSGTILTLFRVTSFDTLFHTNFGVLLLVKVALYLVMDNGHRTAPQGKEEGTVIACSHR